MHFILKPIDYIQFNEFSYSYIPFRGEGHYSNSSNILQHSCCSMSHFTFKIWDIKSLYFAVISGELSDLLRIPLSTLILKSTSEQTDLGLVLTECIRFRTLRRTVENSWWNWIGIQYVCDTWNRIYSTLGAEVLFGIYFHIHWYALTSLTAEAPR